MGRSIKIALVTPILYILLPELAIAWVDQLGPGRAVALMTWLITVIVALSLVVLGGTICLLLKKSRCWPHCSPGRV